MNDEWLWKDFNMPNITEKDSLKRERAGDQRSERRKKRTPIKSSSQKQYWKSRIKLEDFKMFQNFYVMNRFEIFKKNRWTIIV